MKLKRVAFEISYVLHIANISISDSFAGGLDGECLIIHSRFRIQLRLCIYRLALF